MAGRLQQVTTKVNRQNTTGSGGLASLPSHSKIYWKYLFQNSNNEQNQYNKKIDTACCVWKIVSCCKRQANWCHCDVWEDSGMHTTKCLDFSLIIFVQTKCMPRLVYPIVLFSCSQVMKWFCLSHNARIKSLLANGPGDELGPALHKYHWY